ncbi:MAG: HAD hydrolase-like protein [Hyphomicrobiaceae bacterium]|nr:HAD hydrolase-like protein [Hyphomicrobiaceae bacterium]
MDVLIDLDGTLLDPKPGLIGSVQYALDRLGFPVPPADELLWLIGPPFRVSFPKLLGTPELTELAIAHYRERYFAGAMYEAIVYDGVPAALDALGAAGCRLIVATSKPHHYARPILERFDLARRFVGIHGPELDGTNDHKGDLIAHIIAREGVVPERAVMIGDREFDVTAAARNGIPTVGVTWGYGTAGELLAAGACALCPAPAGLAAMVLGLRNRDGGNSCSH